MSLQLQQDECSGSISPLTSLCYLNTNGIEGKRKAVVSWGFICYSIWDATDNIGIVRHPSWWRNSTQVHGQQRGICFLQGGKAAIFLSTKMLKQSQVFPDWTGIQSCKANIRKRAVLLSHTTARIWNNYIKSVEFLGIFSNGNQKLAVSQINKCRKPLLQVQDPPNPLVLE